MSAVDEIVSHLQSVVDNLGDAVNDAQGAHAAADEGLTHAIPAGHERTISGYQAVMDDIDTLISQLNGIKSQADDLIEQAKSITSG